MIQLSQFRLSQMAKEGSKISRSPAVSVDGFDLPINFCIHYITDVASQIGMRGSNPLIRNWSREGSVGLYHVIETGELKHRARSRPISKAAINKYFQNQSVFTKVTKLERTLARERQLLVMDYSVLLSSIITKEGMYKFYHEFDNISDAIVNNIANNTSSRLNLIQLRMPEVLPEKATFNKVSSDEFSTVEAGLWTDYDQLWLRELWLLIEGKGKLAEVVDKTEVFASVSLAGTVTTIDLRRLKQLGEESLNETRNDFYKLLNNLKEAETGTDEEALEDVDEEDIVPESVDEAIIEVTRERVRSGRMTASEQQRFVKLAKESQELKTAGGERLIDFAVTKPEDYQIDKDVPITINENIIAKDRTQNTMSNFNKSYSQKVLDKHIASVATSFTSSGYILKDFSVEEELDVVNHMRMMRLTFLPIEGKETTIEMPVPMIDENGAFKADGVEYSSDIVKVSKN